MSKGPNKASDGTIEPQRLTWVVLLGRWVEFARSAVALPDDEEGRRMRDTVPDVIMLQAVWFALQHLDELDAPQRAVGLDRAEILIERHTRALVGRFAAAMPDRLRELIDDAQAQLERATGGSEGQQPGHADPAN